MWCVTNLLGELHLAQVRVLCTHTGEEGARASRTVTPNKSRTRAHIAASLQYFEGTSVGMEGMYVLRSGSVAVLSADP